MAPNHSGLGSGAVCSVLIKYLHPRQVVKNVFINPGPGMRLDDLVASRVEYRRVNRRDQAVIVFRSESFSSEVYAVKNWVKVLSPSPEASRFQPRILVETVGEEETNDPEPMRLVDNQHENSRAFRAAGVEVDDDNDPAPENIPLEGNPPQESLQDNAWGWSGFCPRRVQGFGERRPSINGLAGVALSSVTILHMFLIFLPRRYIEEVLLVATNSAIEGQPVSFGEFLRWLGIWYLLATNHCASRQEYWSSMPIDMFQGAPFRLHDIMSRNRFEAILSAIRLTNATPPDYQDRFWEVRQVIAAFCEHMTTIFKCGWIACLDESMVVWMNRWTCPGWMVVPRKPHPMGNEVHSICCGLCGIMFGIELVEGKDEPPEKPVDPTNAHGKTVGLLLRLCKPLYATGCVVVLDSGFCVLRGLTELLKKGVFASAVIKKRRYWPRYVDGDAIESRMEGKAIGACDALHGTLDGTGYVLFAMKEPDYTMKIMSTYGGLIVKDGERDSVRSSDGGGQVTFKYTEVFSNHFKFRHAVDDHNNLRQGVLSFEETWATHRWAIRIFSFILAVVEVNVFLAFRYFVWNASQQMDFMPFRKRLAKALIHNEHVPPNSNSPPTRSQRRNNHEIAAAPPHAKKFAQGRWEKSAKKRYQQYTCKSPNCKKMIRTYCSCSPGVWICEACHRIHILSVVREENSL